MCQILWIMRTRALSVTMFISSLHSFPERPIFSPDLLKTVRVGWPLFFLICCSSSMVEYFGSENMSHYGYITERHCNQLQRYQ